MHLLIFLFLLLVLCVPYLIPTIIAYSRQKTNRGAILAVNVLLGWTFVGCERRANGRIALGFGRESHTWLSVVY
jgi:hypothetical protein